MCLLKPTRISNELSSRPPVLPLAALHRSTLSAYSDLGLSHSRSHRAEAKNKKADHELMTKEQEIASLQHKISTLEADLEKSETIIRESKSAKDDGETTRGVNENLTRKIALLEGELETAETNLRETTDKYVRSCLLDRFSSQSLFDRVSIRTGETDDERVLPHSGSDK